MPPERREVGQLKQPELSLPIGDCCVNCKIKVEVIGSLLKMGDLNDSRVILGLCVKGRTLDEVWKIWNQAFLVMEIRHVESRLY